MTSTVMIAHNFETAHRLPFLGGKCDNLHGHSWHTEIAVQRVNDPDETGIVIDFGKLKARVREWIDLYLDHGTMLGVDDPLVEFIEPYGKVYVFGRDWPTKVDDKTVRGWTLAWPSVENVAILLGRVTDNIISEMTYQTDDFGKLRVSQVVVRETAVNAAVWQPCPVVES